MLKDLELLLQKLKAKSSGTIFLCHQFYLEMSILYEAESVTGKKNHF